MENQENLSAEQLVEKYAAMIYRIAYSRLQNVPDSEDVTQEVFLKYIKADKKFNDEDHRRRWLIRVTVNTINSLTRSSARKQTVSLDEAEEIQYTDKEASGIEDAVKQLPEKYRIPIHLFYFEDMAISQIAEILKSPEGTVKSLLSRGRSKLKELLKEDYYVR